MVPVSFTPLGTAWTWFEAWKMSTFGTATLMAGLKILLMNCRTAMRGYVCKWRQRRSVMIERSDISEQRERGDFDARARTRAATHPVVQVVLDPGRTQQQRGRVNADPHDW